MIEYEDQCVNCAEGWCRPSCSLKHVPVLICDICGCETDKLYYYENEQVCAECVLDSLEEVEV